jgi:hypothetical protein
MIPAVRSALFAEVFSDNHDVRCRAAPGNVGASQVTPMLSL